jgi:hypothetical protein
VSAFHGNPAIKAAVLAALDRDPPIPLVEPGGARETVLVEWANEIGLAPALVLLAARLAPSNSLVVEGGPTAFARELLSAIDVGAEVAGVPHAWIAWAWDGATEPLRACMQSADVIEAGAQVIGLHRRATAADPVARGEWRVARARLSSLAQAKDEQGLAASMLAAGAWDFALAPGAADDALGVWEGMFRTRIRRVDGWGEAEDDRLEAVLGKVRPMLREYIGTNPGRADKEAHAIYLERLGNGLAALMSEQDDPIWDRHVALQKAIGAVLSGLRQDGRCAIVRLTQEASQSGRPQPDGHRGAA